MHCPFCRHTDSRVMDSRATDDGSSIRRRRQCPECGRRFTTVETASLSVVKRSGATEPFSRAKVVAGVRKACQGRPVTEDQLALLAQRARGPVYGEDLAWGTGVTAQSVVNNWLASPRHRAVLLRPGFRRIGIGIAFGTFVGHGGAAVVTADFAGR